MKCLFEGCCKPDYAKGLCHTHYTQQRRGKALTPIKKRGSVSITYGGAHMRTRRILGGADTHSCVACGSQAEHWAYMHQSPFEMLDERGLPYSPRAVDYQAMCVPCHKTFDIGVSV